MRKGAVSVPLLITIAAICMIAVLTLVSLVWYMTTSNHATRMWNQGVAVQEDLKNFLDLTKKKIGQTAQVTKAEIDAYEKIIIGQATARGKEGGGSLATSVTEATTSNLDMKTLQNLQNIIAGARDTYAGKQSAALNLQSEYNSYCEIMPNSLILSGRPKMKMVIVTSGEVQEAFVTGQDNNTDIGLGSAPPAEKK